MVLTRRLMMATVALAALAAPALAQGAWPAKPLKIIVPATPGGAIDVIARMVADKLPASLGQPVVVENKPGAANNLGTDFVAKSAPDGYTFVIVASSHATNKFLYKDLGWDPVDSFEPVAYTHVVPLVLAVHPDVPAKTLAEVTAWAKANPDKATYGSSGVGSSLHMSAELYQAMSGVKLPTHVTYKGSSAIHPDLIGGRLALRPLVRARRSALLRPSQPHEPDGLRRRRIRRQADHRHHQHLVRLRPVPRPFQAARRGREARRAAGRRLSRSNCRRSRCRNRPSSRRRCSTATSSPWRPRS
jgi:hypothetical protein